MKKALFVQVIIAISAVSAAVIVIIGTCGYQKYTHTEWYNGRYYSVIKFKYNGETIIYRDEFIEPDKLDSSVKYLSHWGDSMLIMYKKINKK